VLLALLDSIVVLLFLAPELVEKLPWTTVMAARALIAAVLPVVILLLTGLLTAEAKATLIYWRIDNPQPGSEAFTKYAPRDSRIDLTALRKHVGTFPNGRRDQNTKWYKLYLRVASEPSVVESHKFFLMYREMAVMSLPLIFLGPALLHWAGASWTSEILTATFFLSQYAMTTISARHSGVRFVQNVLALHSAKKIA